MTFYEPQNKEGLTKRRTRERAKRVTRRRAERKRERERGVGMSDKEQGEWLPSIPNTDTDNASLLGQSPQSTDVPLPRPPPHTQPRRVRCCDCLAFWLEPVFVRCYLLFHIALPIGSAWALMFANEWVFSDLPVWVKVLLGIYAAPAALYVLYLCYDDYRSRRNNVVS